MIYTPTWVKTFEGVSFNSYYISAAHQVSSNNMNVLTILQQRSINAITSKRNGAVNAYYDGRDTPVNCHLQLTNLSQLAVVVKYPTINSKLPQLHLRPVKRHQRLKF